VQLRELTIVKSGSRREPFDRGKLERSLAIALRKRPGRRERTRSCSPRSSASSRSAANRGPVQPDRRNGDGRLKALDTVAYIRFASVYKDFREARDFEEFAGTVGEPGEE
jgi:transcriptional repressor NrdR